MMVACGNPGHPSGEWHAAAPLPMFTVWNWRARLAYWWRTKRWGCGCPRKPELVCTCTEPGYGCSLCGGERAGKE